MKKIIAMLLLTVSATAMADQCQIMSGAAAKRAALLVKNNSEIAEVCQPCGEKVRDAKISVVRKAELQGNELFINGKSKDMAYTFIKVAPNNYVNIAKVIGCPVHDVSDSISK